MLRIFQLSQFFPSHCTIVFSLSWYNVVIESRFILQFVIVSVFTTPVLTCFCWCSCYSCLYIIKHASSQVLKSRCGSVL